MTTVTNAGLLNGLPDRIARAFYWKSSPQGEEYWSEVCQNLLEILYESDEPDETNENNPFKIEGWDL